MAAGMTVTSMLLALIAVMAMLIAVPVVDAFTSIAPSARTNHRRHQLLCAAALVYPPTVAETLDARDRLLTVLITPSSSQEVSRGRDAVQVIKQCVATLELSQAKSDTLTFPALWEAIDGDWVLKYSNNAGATITNAAGLPGAVRAVVAGVRSPTLTVVQRIQGAAGRVDHVLQLPYNRGTITLHHDARVSSDHRPAQVAIDLHSVRLDGRVIKNRTLRLPGPSYLRRGYFDVTYVDDALRISRGPYGELRVFTRTR